ncbi:MAG TPA: threonine synthase, partial [Lachnospiraceae bacterium]|nr:threonine synthase [Lachnospiraceae bacterium]
MSIMYKSTRGGDEISASQAILQGLAPNGGLYVPTSIPALDKSFDELKEMSYQEVAYEVMKLYLTDFTDEELSMCVEGAYKKGKFSSDRVAPLHKLTDSAEVLELWRGPTCAFKDMALQ